LRSFIAVVKLKSFTQAATVLHVSQPTPTAQIKTLEDALRLRLFGRRRRTNAIATDAKRVLQDLDTVLLNVRDVVAVAPQRSADRRAAASLLQPLTCRLPRKGRSSPRKIGGIFAVANGLPHLAAAAKFSTAPR
jgi:DNA-binding transcriptional LysR family regulator